MCAICAQAALADPARHDMTAGRLVEYEVSVEVTRDRRGPAEWTQISDRQTGYLVRYVMSADAHRAQRVELLKLAPAEVVSATRDGVGISPRPSGAALRLDPGGVYMTVTEVTPSDAPSLVPTGTDGRLIGIALLLAAPRWPEKPAATWTSVVTIGDDDASVTWRAEDAGTSALEAGTQTFTAAIEAAAAASAGGARGITLDATLVWDEVNQVLQRVSGTARYRVSDYRYDDAYLVTLTRTRRRLDDLATADRRTMRDSILALNDAIATHRRGDRDAAERAARAFIQRWPSSPWRPTIDRLLDDLSNADDASVAAPPETAAPKELLAQLGDAMAAWQTADRTADERARAQLRATLAPQVAGARDTIREFLSADDPGPRAVAVFALAFTDDGLDLLALQDATGDADARVRAWAAYALAIRADSRTEFRTLRLLARDEDANVRARACEAIAACIAPDGKDARAARTLLLDRLSDEFDGVRYHAALALTRLAEPADLGRIEAARNVEPTETVTEALDRLMDRLRAASDGP